ncbi:MAG: hypothetical protein AAB403_11525 [Planctomycetota bacterium]
MEDEIVRDVPEDEVGGRVTVWMGSSPKSIIIVKQADGLYTITVKL